MRSNRINTISVFLSFQVKIWFQNRRTKWKKQDNISNTEAAEHKTTTTSKTSSNSGQQRDNETKSNCTSSPPPDSPNPLQSHLHPHSTPIVNSKPMNGHHSHYGEKKHHHHHPQSPSASSVSSSSPSSSAAKYKQKLSRDEALFKTQSPAAAAAYLPHHNPLFSMMAAAAHHQQHHPLDHSPHHSDIEARLAASKISLSAFSKVGDPRGMELSPMLSIGAMSRLPRP